MSLVHYEEYPLEQLAKYADKVSTEPLDTQHSSAIANSPPPSNQKLINEQFESKLNTLQQSFHELFQSQPHSPFSRNFDQSPLENSTNPSMKGSSQKLCNYHYRFGSAARNCAGPSCPFFTRPTGRPKSHLHGFSASHALTAEHLFFIQEKISGIQFLVDTGASHSIYPLQEIGTERLDHCDFSLYAVGGDKLTVLGKFYQHLDLGFSRRFGFDFYVVDLPYDILGADFLQHYNLLVNVSAKHLSETLDLEKFGLPNSGEFVIDNTFAPTGDRQSDKNIMTELHRDYAEVFDPALRSRVPKHSI